MSLRHTLGDFDSESKSPVPGPFGPGRDEIKRMKKKDKDLKEGDESEVSNSSDLIGMDRRVMVERKMIKVREEIRI